MSLMSAAKCEAALRASVIAFGILAFFAFAGHLMDALGVSMPAFRIAGGLMLLISPSR